MSGANEIAIPSRNVIATYRGNRKQGQSSKDNNIPKKEKAKSKPEQQSKQKEPEKTQKSNGGAKAAAVGAAAAVGVAAAAAGGGGGGVGGGVPAAASAKNADPAGDAGAVNAGEVNATEAESTSTAEEKAAVAAGGAAVVAGLVGASKAANTTVEEPESDIPVNTETGLSEDETVAVVAGSTAAAAGGAVAVAAVASSHEEEPENIDNADEPAPVENQPVAEEPAITDEEVAAVAGAATVAAVGGVAAAKSSKPLPTKESGVVLLNERRKDKLQKLEKDKYVAGAVIADDGIPPKSDYHQLPKYEHRFGAVVGAPLVIAENKPKLAGNKQPQGAIFASSAFDPNSQRQEQFNPSVEKSHFSEGAIIVVGEHPVQDRNLLAKHPKKNWGQGMIFGANDRVANQAYEVSPQLEKKDWARGAVLGDELIPAKTGASPTLRRHEWTQGAVVGSNGLPPVDGENSPSLARHQFSEGAVVGAIPKKLVNVPPLQKNQWSGGNVMVVGELPSKREVNAAPKLPKKEWASGAILGERPFSDIRDDRKPLMTDPFRKRDNGLYTRAGTSSNIIASSNYVEPLDPSLFGEDPVAVTCPHCGKDIDTVVHHKPGGKAFKWCCIMSLFIVPLVFCLSWIPMCMKRCLDVEHTCPWCLRLVNRRKRK